MMDSALSFEGTLSEISAINKDYVRNRFVFVAGDKMVALLKGLGATETDLERVKLVGDGLPDDPTLPFRKTKNGRFCFDPDNGKIYRGGFQPFTLTTEEDFVRHDSGQVREFAEVQNDLQLNSALQALLLFKLMVIHDASTTHRPKLDYDTPRWICTLFNTRTVTNQEILGEPALEGVHTDGADHTMTTFLDSTNMTDDSAITFLHDMQEKNAIRWHETDPELMRGRAQHRDFLDTLLVFDHERKHSLSPVEAVDKQRPSTRDMLIFFTRKPTTIDHPAHVYDSLDPHQDMPMSIDLQREHLAQHNGYAVKE